MIIIDKNEPEYYKEELRRRLYGRVKIDSIEYCDYLIIGKSMTVAVERKTPSDLVNSIKDGRLFNQAYMMSRNHRVSFLVVEGYLAEALIHSKIRKESLLGALISISLRTSGEGENGRISVVMLDMPEDVVGFLVLLHRQLEKGDLYITPKLAVRGKRTLTVKEATVKMLQSIPYIGDKTARKIADRYHSIAQLILHKDELIKLFGAKTGSRILCYLGLNRYCLGESS